MRTKLFALLFAFAAWVSLFQAAPASAQAFVVATCGTLPVAYRANTGGRPLVVDINGNLCVSDGAIGITPTDRTITSATGSSQQVAAANTSRHSLTVINTGNANCGINPTGGTAAIGGAGTLTLAPLGAYTPRIPTLSAVTAICTSGQPLYADEN